MPPTSRPKTSARNSAAHTLPRFSVPVASSGSGFLMYALRRFKSHVGQSGGSFMSRNDRTMPGNGSSLLSLNSACRFLISSSMALGRYRASPCLQRSTASAHSWSRSRPNASRGSSCFLRLASTCITQNLRLPVSPFRKYASLVVPQNTHWRGCLSTTVP